MYEFPSAPHCMLIRSHVDSCCMLLADLDTSTSDSNEKKVFLFVRETIARALTASLLLLPIDPELLDPATDRENCRVACDAFVRENPSLRSFAGILLSGLADISGVGKLRGSAAKDIRSVLQELDRSNLAMGMVRGGFVTQRAEESIDISLVRNKLQIDVEIADDFSAVVVFGVNSLKLNSATCMIMSD